ncbi:MAG: cupin domain-containing protein [Rubrivivax sp.]
MPGVALRQSFEGHAGFERLREELAVLEAHELGPVVAEGLLGPSCTRTSSPAAWPASAASTGASRSWPPKKNSTGSFSSSMGGFWASASNHVRLTTQGALICIGRSSHRVGENPPMDLDAPAALLGGLSPAEFMRRHWQRKPPVVRQALLGVRPPLARAPLFALAARDDVESRLVLREGRAGSCATAPLRAAACRRWRSASGRWCRGWTCTCRRRTSCSRASASSPTRGSTTWMVSWASDGGGVGPHLDSYDVFLVQVHGRRRWRVGRVADPAWVGGRRCAS